MYSCLCFETVVIHLFCFVVGEVLQRERHRRYAWKHHKLTFFTLPLHWVWDWAWDLGGASHF